MEDNKGCRGYMLSTSTIEKKGKEDVIYDIMTKSTRICVFNFLGVCKLF